MEIDFTAFLNTILFLGAIQGIILTVILFNVKSNQLSNRLLGTLTFLWAILLSLFALQSYGLFYNFPHLLYTFSSLIFAWFPLLYLSIKYLISSHNKFQKPDFLHFIPMIFHVLMFTPFYLKSGAEKLEIINKNEGYYFWADVVSEEILALQGIVYTILALALIQNYKKNIVDYQSNINSKVLNGYRIGIILALVAWVVGIIGAHIEKLDIDLGIDLFMIVYLIFVAIIYLLSILTLRSPEVFKLSKSELRQVKSKTAIKSPDNKIDQIKDINQSYKIEEDKNNNLRDEYLSNMLLELMKKEKPYLNPDLSLQEMAEKLNVSRHNLSAIINQQQKMNFYEFVNAYRIEEVKQLMKTPENKNKNNYDLAFDAGFNSKASFYRIFKQVTHQTPSEYRLEIKN